MIKSNELRIGNWVNAGNSAIQLNRKSFEYAVCRFMAKDLSPIILTPEILEKCGFKIEYDDDEIFARQDYKSSFPWCLEYNLAFSYWEDRESFYGIETKIKHLHQLQNLYHALTGEELNPEL